MNDLTPARLRDLKRESTLRPFDLAAQLGLSEAALIEAELGHDAIRIDVTPGRLIPAVQALGEVMALTRNRSCVIEKLGTYNNFHDGDHAAMVLDPEIDLRIFPRHWVHAYAIEAEGKNGPRRSVQVFDAAGDAVHKVHLRAGSNLAAWDALRRDLALPDQAGLSDFAPRPPVEGPRIDPARADTLRSEWAGMTDTHQFNTLVRRLKMNRLGAYHLVGAPFVRRLDVAANDALFTALQAQGLTAMLFVGNMGCIEIHSGRFENLKPMGPWLNVMDDRFNLHLRADHVAEIWQVEKPTKRGPAISVEAFDEHGALIYQCFGMRAEKGGDPQAWADLVNGLPGAA
ncbi:MAG: ChuX/HutX family heme-like substrate-binding protein [Paracoccus sp. (in: a-proteobacteria)]|uniref:hemin-degrading factor n=1 Tax=Paracoccus sp. TaxID=267 RepID=UPI0026E072E9|nr:ChuX/HutX family heme-like substrate-binding protein [Paracoccus sp. (in: a-proteobacteria)]MDO5631589.1 ChuX/HutX family heme-like substrate-binding protein [Paracoccus sp. (in: a-proteobacteria)]